MTSSTGSRVQRSEPWSNRLAHDRGAKQGNLSAVSAKERAVADWVRPGATDATTHGLSPNLATMSVEA